MYYEYNLTGFQNVFQGCPGSWNPKGSYGSTGMAAYPRLLLQGDM